MKWFNVFLGCCWIGIGIAAFCGVDWNPITAGCACIAAGLNYF